MKMRHSQTQEISHDPLVNANILNSHFVPVGSRLASELPNGNRHFSNYLPRTTYSGSFVFETVLPSEIELEIIITPSNKAHGLYPCPIRLLKCSRQIISKPIANIVNQLVCMGIFPSKLKHAKIIPIYKDGNEDDPVRNTPFMTKCEPLLNVDFILLLCTVSPGGHEDLQLVVSGETLYFVKDSRRVDKPPVATYCVAGVVRGDGHVAVVYWVV